MQNEVVVALRHAIDRSLPVLKPMPAQYKEVTLTWRRNGPRSWRGEYTLQPNMTQIFSAARHVLEDEGKQFLEVFRRAYPQYAADNGLIGSPSFGFINIISDPSYLLGCVLGEIWDRYQTFDCNGDVVEIITNDFGDFLDHPIAKVKYRALLLNYHMEMPEISFADGLKIRKLNEGEVSEIYGGPLTRPSIAPNATLGINDCAIEGSYEEEVTSSIGKVVEPPFMNQVKPKLDKVVVALRTFKEGKVGYSIIAIKPISFSPMARMSFTYGDLYVPQGNYTVTDEEVESLRKHVALLSGKLDSAMELACSRLADAEIRIRPMDRLIDAVIGLEALLLAGLSKEDRRGELRYRFSLNYACLSPSPKERFRSFHIAKDLYDLRSTIAHGSLPKNNKCTIGDEEMNLDEAAKKACEVLREVVNYFLKFEPSAPYKDHKYWERRYFGDIA